MGIAVIMIPPGVIKTINILVLLAVIAIIAWLPAHKEVWYDETISMMCSKGIRNNPDLLSDSTHLTSRFIEQFNNSKDVFGATVTDNANSWLYNQLLHWTTCIAGNTFSAYMLLSRVCTIVAFLFFYLLCEQLWGSSLLTSVAIALLAFDVDFLGMSHEIRAYSMAGMFACISGYYFVRYLKDGFTVRRLFLIVLLSSAMVLSHFLTVYIVLLYALGLLVYGFRQVFTVRSVVAILVAILPVALFFLSAWQGLQVMSQQNAKIAQLHAGVGFSAMHVIWQSLRFVSLNFKLPLAAFGNIHWVSMGVFLALCGLFIVALRTGQGVQKRIVVFLFLLGGSSTAFLAFLCFKSGHYTALYYRYHTFAIPFAVLFTVYALYILGTSRKSMQYVQYLVLVVSVSLSGYLFILGLKSPAYLKYNHFAIAASIMEHNVHEVSLPSWRDAWLIQCRLSRGYELNYHKMPNTTSFVFDIDGKRQDIPVIAKDN